MKEGWTYRKLGEVCNVVGGGTPDTKNKNYWNGNIPWATVGDMNCDEIKSTGYYITDRGLNESSSRIVKSGEIIIATRVGLGKVCKLAVDTAINQDLKGIIPKDNSILRNFIFYYFKKNAKYIVDNGVGATVKGVKIKFIEGLSFGYPSLSEQQSIVDYLDSAFAKIDAMKANAEKALNEAKALFQASLKEMLEPKEVWEETTFGDLVVSNVVGMTRGKVEQGYDKKYPYFKMNNISPDNALCWDDLICVDANKEELDKYSLQEGDFLFNTRNSKEWVGKSAVYRNYCTPVMLYNNNVMRIRFVDVINPVFIAYSFLADYTKEQLEKIKSGTTNVWAIYYRDLSKILLTYPSPAEQKAIVETLDSLKSKVDRLQENYDKISQECDALKQAILRQVFE